MRNSLKAVVFGAISIVFSAGLQAEVHQHEMMSAASEGTSEQLITGNGIVKDIDCNIKDDVVEMMVLTTTHSVFADMIISECGKKFKRVLGRELAIKNKVIAPV